MLQDFTHFPAALSFAEELKSRLDLRVDADCIFSSSHKAPQNPDSEKIQNRRFLLKLEDYASLRVDTNSFFSKFMPFKILLLGMFSTPSGN